MVPKSIRRNIQWRLKVARLCARTVKYRRMIMRMCRKNILFWINLFVFTLDTRKTKAGTMAPFITFECQDEAILKIQKAIFPEGNGAQHTIGIEKSRDMGATWICALVLLHAVLFRQDLVEFFIMSYKEEVVDGSFASVMGKMRLVLDYLPSWMVPKISKPQLMIKNLQTGSSIKGSSTTTDSGVSGRYTAMFFDEFALVEDAHTLWPRTSACADCRIVNSTHRGTATQFHEIIKQAHVVPLEQEIVDRGFTEKVQLHWMQHPWKAKGAWRDEQGKWWSPWYKQECARLGWNKQAIAQELDMDPQGSGWQFFDPEEIKRLVKEFSQKPVRTGIMGDGQFSERQGGNVRLWFAGSPPKGKYGIGNDVAGGSGGKHGTASCASVVNLETGEKLCECSDANLRPDQFARLVADLGKWFHNAQIVWENTGSTGSIFRKALLSDLGYSNVYLRRREIKITSEQTLEPGWIPTPANKHQLLEEYRTALSTGEFLNRSEPALLETLQFVYNEGNVEHALEKIKGDHAGAKALHGDQVIADALANLLVKEAGILKQKTPGGSEESGPPPYGSIAWRDMMEQEDEWDGW